MTMQQKEGLIIVAVAVILAATLCLASSWGDPGYSGKPISFQSATVGPKWPTVEARTELGQTYDKKILRVELVNALYVNSLILIYGVLRACNIVRRLFKFEELLSKLVPK